MKKKITLLSTIIVDTNSEYYSELIEDLNSVESGEYDKEIIEDSNGAISDCKSSITIENVE